MRNSTLILAAAIAIGAMAGVSAASAADLAAKAPVVDTSYHWSGWYVGGNAGWLLVQLNQYLWIGSRRRCPRRPVPSACAFRKSKRIPGRASVRSELPDWKY